MTKNKYLHTIAAFILCAVMIFGLSVSTFADTASFKYIHDPKDNPAAMKDIVADNTAVYGFRPSETGSIANYAVYDWSDPAIVEAGRQERIAYHNSFQEMYDILESMQKEGKTAEEIARVISPKRNELRLASYANDPEGLAVAKQRNLTKYGREEGPTPEQMYDLYGSWEKVIEKSFSTNMGMDACLGLYDDYYNVYVMLGQVKPDTPQTTDTATESVATTSQNTSPKTAENGYIDYTVLLLFLLCGAASTLAIKKNSI